MSDQTDALRQAETTRVVGGPNITDAAEPQPAGGSDVEDAAAEPTKKSSSSKSKSGSKSGAKSGADTYEFFGHVDAPRNNTERIVLADGKTLEVGGDAVALSKTALDDLRERGFVLRKK